MGSSAAAEVPPSPVRIRGPAFEVELSSFDAKFSGFYSRRVLVFRTKSPPNVIFSTFVLALQRLVQKIPVLGGVVTLSDTPGPTGQKGWRQVRQGEGIILHANDLRSTEALAIDSLETSNFAPTLLPDDKLMPVPPEGRTEPFDVTELQLNFVTGGVLLSCCFAHIAGDGTSMSEMLRLLARYHSDVQTLGKDVQTPSDSNSNQEQHQHQLSTSPQLGLDRTVLRGLKAKNGWSAANYPAMEITRQTQEPDASTTESSPPPVMVQKVYRITESMLQKVKRDATSVRISTNDAITSVVWRALAVNRIAGGALPGSEPSLKLKLFSSVSAAPILGLPSDYMGNTFILRQCEASVAEIVGSQSLQTLAALHRSEINRVTPDLIAGCCQMAESAEFTSDFSPVFLPTMGTTGFVLTSCYHRETLLTSDWGPNLGHSAVRLRCTDLGFAGALRPLHFVLPCMPGGAGAEVQLDVYPSGIAAMEKDELFSRYFQVP